MTENKVVSAEKTAETSHESIAESFELRCWCTVRLDRNSSTDFLSRVGSVELVLHTKQMRT